MGYDNDYRLWVAYKKWGGISCGYRDSSGMWQSRTVFESEGAVTAGPPSLAMYPGAEPNVANVAFAVYDTIANTSAIMYAKVDGNSVLLDTIDTANGLGDSCPEVCVANSDSIFVTWQHDGQVSSTMLEYAAGSWAPPGGWSAPESVAAGGCHPASCLDGEFLFCVWREFLPQSDTQAIRSAVRYVGSDTMMFQGWMQGPDRSQWDEHPKDYPVAAGCDVVVWQERASENDPSNIRAYVWGDTVTLVPTGSNSYHPHAVAEMSAPSPSIDQIRAKLLWTEEVLQDGDTFGELRFEVDSINRSHAGPSSTAPNNGCKLIRKPGGDSLFAVYRDMGWSLVYAWSADGAEWQREPLFGRTSAVDHGTGMGAATIGTLRDPALAHDGTGRPWVVFVKPALPEAGDSTSQVLGSFRCEDTWSTPQVLYAVRCDSGWTSSPSLAGASVTETPFAYAPFVAGRRDTPELVVAKFDGTSLATSSAPLSANSAEPPCISTWPDAGGDDLHLCWPAQGEVYYTMTGEPVPADSWSPDPMAWNTPVNLSASTPWSWMPVVGAGQDRVVVAWTEEGDWEQGIMPDILARFRSQDSAYDNWEGSVNLSQSPYRFSDSPVLAFAGDSVAVVWQEGPGWSTTTASHDRTTTDANYQDIMASIDFGGPLLLASEPLACFPHAALENEASGDSSLGHIHAVWSEQPRENYFEVGYRKCDLHASGGGGQQSAGGPTILPLLYACRPNPFARRTQISYQFPHAGQVLLRVYDASGRAVRTLQDGRQKPGIYTVNWDGQDDRGRTVANGVYFYRVDAPGLRDTKKAVLMK